MSKRGALHEQKHFRTAGYRPRLVGGPTKNWGFEGEGVLAGDKRDDRREQQAAPAVRTSLVLRVSEHRLPLRIVVAWPRAPGRGAHANLARQGPAVLSLDLRRVTEEQ